MTVPCAIITARGSSSCSFCPCSSSSCANVVNCDLDSEPVSFPFAVPIRLYALYILRPLVQDEVDAGDPVHLLGVLVRLCWTDALRPTKPFAWVWCLLFATVFPDQRVTARIRRACRRRQLTSPSISNARVAANAQGQDQGGFGATSQVSAGFGVASASGASGGVSARPSASVSASGGASSRVSATTSAAETTQSGTAAGGARNAAANGRGRGSGAGTGNANANANGTSIGTGTGRGNGNGNAQAGNGNTGDIETSTTLDPAVIQAGSAQNGNPTDGQVASLTSTNNFVRALCLLRSATANGTLKDQLLRDQGSAWRSAYERHPDQGPAGLQPYPYGHGASLPP